MSKQFDSISESKRKKVWLVHVRYQVRGGEDIHVQMLKDAYSAIGIDAIALPNSLSPPTQLAGPALQSLLPSSHSSELEAMLATGRPDFVHIHNIFPLLGPRFLRHLRTLNLPVIMTVHNHRFFCTNGLALRDGKNCKLCFDKTLPWPSLAHNCNQDWKRSVYYTSALGEIRAENLLESTVDRFIAPSPYIQGELEQFGIPRTKIRNILHPTVVPQRKSLTKEFDVVYAGRLSHEKGISTLLAAIKLLPDVKFVIVGDGPESETVRLAATHLPNLSYFSGRTHTDVLDFIGKSRIGVLPSICNEILSLFVLEVFAQGKRCVVSDSESMRWFEGGSFPGHIAKTSDPADLARVIRTTIALPELSESERKALATRLGLERFCGELKALVEELLA